jgi:hypothetical protein
VRENNQVKAKTNLLKEKNNPIVKRTTKGRRNSIK